MATALILGGTPATLQSSLLSEGASLSFGGGGNTLTTLASTATGNTATITEGANVNTYMTSQFVAGSSQIGFNATALNIVCVDTNLYNPISGNAGFSFDSPGPTISRLSYTDNAGGGTNYPLLTATGSGGPPATAVSVALPQFVGHTSVAQCGQAGFGTGTSVLSLPIANPLITANSIGLISVVGATPDATATTFSVVLTPGVGFTVKANANATAPTNIVWFVARY